jgi:PIN domain nuclease of toxin-antitoxin system
VAWLFYHQRLQLNAEVVAWMDEALKRPKIELLPFTPAAAIRAAGLGGSFPSDPADRFIVGSAPHYRQVNARYNPARINANDTGATIIA